jgi:hypothetical protein
MTSPSHRVSSSRIPTLNGSSFSSTGRRDFTQSGQS